MVQRDAARYDVAARVTRVDRQLVVPRHCVDRFGFDERDFPGRPRSVGVRAARVEITIAFEALSRNRPYFRYRSRRCLRLRCDVDGHDVPRPRCRLRHDASKGPAILMISYGESATKASTSISTSILGSRRPATWMRVAAGLTSLKNSAWARPTSFQSSMFVTNIRVRTTSARLAPAFSRAVSIFRKMYTAWR